jgi:Tfp pilus assembly protein PilW
MHISKKRFTRLKKGVTLIELLIGMFIFTLMIVAMTMVMVTILNRQSNIKAMQADTEEHSLIMSYLAKKIRMSTYNSSTSNSITVKDHSTGLLLTFTFTTEGGKPVLKEGNGATSSVIARNIDGLFIATNTNSNQAPRVTILLKKPTSIDAAVQTTVSLRSY